jgi:NAD(P)H-flavin reductase
VPDVLPRLLDGVRGFDEHEAYVAGPAPMVRGTVTALQRLGTPLTRIHHDLLAAGG